MEEIAENVYVEMEFPRVTLGLLKLDHGLIIVDSPFSIEDIHTWQSKLSHFGGGMDRFIFLTDAHIDRTLTVRSMETMVIGHENIKEFIRNLSTSLKDGELELSPGWDQPDLPPGIRSGKPQLTFSHQALIHWDSSPIVLSHKPGSHNAGAWMIYDEKKVVFVGDSVVVDQPPFLAYSDLDKWIENLNSLDSDRFQDYLIVSGRNGLITMEAVRKMAAFLSRTKSLLNEVSNQEEPISHIPDIVSTLLREIDYDPQMRERYAIRLRWGLEQYINRHFSKLESDINQEDE